MTAPASEEPGPSASSEWLEFREHARKLCVEALPSALEACAGQPRPDRGFLRQLATTVAEAAAYKNRSAPPVEDGRHAAVLQFLADHGLLTAVLPLSLLLTAIHLRCGPLTAATLLDVGSIDLAASGAGAAMRAVQRGDTARLLVARGARLPRDVATQHLHSVVYLHADRADMAAALLDAGADVHAVDPKNGFTPIQTVLFDRRGDTAELVDVLLRAGAHPDSHVRDKAHNISGTPIDVCRAAMQNRLTDGMAEPHAVKLLKVDCKLVRLFLRARAWRRRRHLTQVLRAGD